MLPAKVGQPIMHCIRSLYRLPGLQGNRRCIDADPEILSRVRHFQSVFMVVSRVELFIDRHHVSIGEVHECAADTIQAAVDELPILQSLGWLSEYRLAAAQFCCFSEIDPPEEGPVACTANACPDSIRVLVTLWCNWRCPRVLVYIHSMMK